MLYYVKHDVIKCVSLFLSKFPGNYWNIQIITYHQRIFIIYFKKKLILMQMLKICTNDDQNIVNDKQQ